MKVPRMTTVALEANQYLRPMFEASIVETYCKGYTDGKLDKRISGYYFTSELRPAPITKQ